MTELTDNDSQDSDKKKLWQILEQNKKKYERTF